MPSYHIQKIAAILKSQQVGNANLLIKNLLTDSRNVFYPADSLFFAIRGERHDGHSFISDLYEVGVKAFVVEYIPESVKNIADCVFLVVDNVLNALQKLAAYHREQFTNPVITITGSNGKTVVKEWLYQAVHNYKHIVRSPKSYNSQIGVPLSIWQIEAFHDLAVIEAGISMPGEMAKLESIIKPDIGVITNIGEPHQENFTDLQQKCNEKIKLFRHCKTLVYCKDHSLIAEALQQPEYADIEQITWSRQSATSDVYVQLVSVKQRTTAISGIYMQEQRFSFDIPFTDEASIENSLHVSTLLFALGFDANVIGKMLLQLSPVAMRLELKQGINNCTVINDSYNSDLGSLTIALDYLEHQKQHTKKTVILSDILQSGRSSELLYREVSGLLAQKNIERFIGIGPELLKFSSLFAAGSRFYPDTTSFINDITRESFANETILLKGSRTFQFENILVFLEKKVHETVLEINLNALVHNLNYFRSLLKPGVKMVAMVKAFSYGSGSFEIANVLQFQRVDYLAVAFADEGVALRDSGITVPIMVMNPEKSSFNTIIRNHFEPEIYSFKELESFKAAVEKAGQKHFPVHLKMDTGMHRLGFMREELDILGEWLGNTDAIKVQSVFSHLAGSDEAQFDEFTHYQIDNFQYASDKIQAHLNYPIIRHILNSAGIERFSEAQFDMVRLGIGLYGISAVDQAMVKNVSTLKTNILQIKNISSNESVGYSRRFMASRETKVGILPIGYADGLHRILGNGVGKLLVNGYFVPIIGSICMDMCMVDLTGVNANEGDEVIIFGEKYPVTELAKQMKTIPYEVFTSISPRVKRIYYQE
jgi:Alr-MurF fusion protein